MNQNEAATLMARAVEDLLVERRDRRISLLDVPNGLVIRERSGQASSVVRLSTKHAMEVALKALIEAGVRL